MYALTSGEEGLKYVVVYILSAEDPKTETKRTRYTLGNHEDEKYVRSRKSKIRWVVVVYLYYLHYFKMSTH